MDAIFVPWLWADVNMAGERQLFPLGSAEAGGELCISRGRIAKTIAIAIPSVWSEMCVAHADRSSEALRKDDAGATSVLNHRECDADYEQNRATNLLIN